MRSKTAKKILNRTTTETKEKVSKYAKSLMEKQTAVQWIISELYPSNEIFGCPNDLFKQALEMERHQIVDAVNKGITICGMGHVFKESSEQYYNYTYNTEQ